MQQGVDSRALFAAFVTKLPRLLILAVAGAVVGSGLYLLIVLVKMQDICYVSETEYYIQFAEGQYEAKNYYNAYTWNDVLGINGILGRAMEILGNGYDRSQVREMIRADIFSDVRYLTITVKGQDAKQVEEIKNALRTALEEFGAVMEEFASIYQIKDLEIVQEEIPLFAWRAAFLGAVIAAGIGGFVTAFCFCMGSVFYTKRDITVRLGLPVYGMTFRKKHHTDKDNPLEKRQTDMLCEGLKLLAENYTKILLMDADGGQEAAAFLRDISDRGLVDCSRFGLYDAEKEAKDTGGDSAVMAVIPFGRPYREKITDEIDFVQLHGGRVVAAVLTQADRIWSMVYYAQQRIGKNIDRS